MQCAPPVRDALGSSIEAVHTDFRPGEVMHVALDASQMYANNVFNLIQHAWNAEEERMVLDPDDDVIGSALLVHDGRVRDARVRSALGLEDAAPAESGGAA